MGHPPDEVTVGKVQRARAPDLAEFGVGQETSVVPGVHPGTRDDPPAGASSQRAVPGINGQCHAPMAGLARHPEPLAAGSRRLDLLKRRNTGTSLDAARRIGATREWKVSVLSVVRRPATIFLIF